MHRRPRKVASSFCPAPHENTSNLQTRRSFRASNTCKRCNPPPGPRNVSTLPAWTSIQIHMVTRLASGDAVVAAAEAALGDGDSEKATQLLREAKSFYHHAQVRNDKGIAHVRAGVVSYDHFVCTGGFLQKFVLQLWPDLVRARNGSVRFLPACSRRIVAGRGKGFPDCGSVERVERRRRSRAVFFTSKHT